MNSLAVALATDSAATVSVGRGNKIYNSADKLFMLSKRHPVGVMVYNSASLLGIPWETLLKMFREHLRNTEYPTLEEYGHHIIRFLDHNKHLFPESVQYQHYLRIVEILYRGINKGIETRILADIREGNADPNREAIARDFIQKSLATWHAEPEAERLDPSAGSDLASRGSDKVRAAVNKCFPHLKLQRNEIQALRELAMLVVNKRKILDEIRSGLVVAGFGRDEYFPVMQCFELGEVYLNRLKYHQAPTQKISADERSLVQPFAQSDMVKTFLGGISPEFRKRAVSEFVEFATDLPNKVIDQISDLSTAQRDHWKKHMRPRSEKAAEQLVIELELYRHRRHLAPILAAITHLPKDELAHVAASLVNLNSFQKRVSMEQETVGGPIDVAIITKGDGFIWIDRKHYFRPELNHQFFRNYTADIDAETTAEVRVEPIPNTGTHTDGQEAHSKSNTGDPEARNHGRRRTHPRTASSTSGRRGRTSRR